MAPEPATSDYRQPSARDVVNKADPAEENYTRNCPLCGHQNPGDQQTCLICTAPLGTSCPNCQRPVALGSRFCGQCGTPLADSQPSPNAPDPAAEITPELSNQTPIALAEKITSAAVKTSGERREVTILFVDVTNFTAASHNLDSEDVYEFINAAMSTLVEVVRQYGGTIDKFTGDGLMALFGAPVAHENDPERAVRAALQMQQALEPWQKQVKGEHGLDLQIRIGINTGWVIAGKVGNDFHMEYTVIGDTVNLASRLEATAEPGTVLVSAETYQRTRRVVEYCLLPPVTVKGIPEPVQAYRPQGRLEKPKKGTGLPELKVPMVGRARQFEQLQEAMVAVRQFYHRRIALVSGEAGLGKSRLVAEFRRTLVRSDIKVYQGSCSPYSHNRPLALLAGIVRHLVGLPDDAPADYQRQALQEYLSRYNLATDEVLPYLLHVLGLAQIDPQSQARQELLDAAMRQQQTHAALRQVFVAAARLSPTVLIFEDLHWIDSASRNFLEYLIQSTDDVPLLLILVSRQAERKTILQSLVTAAEQDPERLIDLQLQPLTAAERQLLIDELLKHTTTEAIALKRRIGARAEGNPFYAEEIIRMLIDQGGLLPSKATGMWEVTPQAGELLDQIPGTVKGLILARIDRLPESIRQTLQKGALIGTTFPVSLLQALNGMSIKTMGAHLAELEARQFLSPRPFRSEPGYILNWPPDEKTEALAHHYFESTQPARAVPYLIEAADKAAARCAYEAAIEHYRRALKLLPEQPNGIDSDFFQVRIGLGRALKFTAELAEAGRLLSDVVQQLSDNCLAQYSAREGAILVESLLELADVRQREGAYAEALTLLEAGLQVIEQAGAHQESLQWLSLFDRMAWIHFRQGQLEEAAALAHFATADLTVENAKDPIRLASLYNTLGGICWQQGKLEQAVSHVEGSLRLHKRSGYLWGQAIAYGNLGILYDALGKWPRAVEYYEQAYNLQEKIGDRQHQVTTVINLATMHLQLGKHEAAWQDLETGLAIARQLGDTWGTAVCQVNMAELVLIQPDLELCKKYAEEALALADEIESTEIRVQARCCLAVALAGTERETSLGLAGRALELAQEAKLQAEEANCYRTLGSLFRRAGRHDEAETYLRDSVELSAKQNDPYRHGLALLELGRLYLDLAQTDGSSNTTLLARAASSLNEAADKFEALGAAYDLQVTRQVLSQI
jgi:class 3 adenylate cyclase/Tfp pilus assembly protein PilF